MQSYKRKITYFYQFHNGNVGSTAGFLKLEIRGEKVKIIINIQEPPGLPYPKASLYFYHEAGDSLSAVKVAEIESNGGVLSYQSRTDWQHIFDTDRDLYTFDGVAVAYNDSHYYIGDFQDKNRKGYDLIIKEPRRVMVSEPVKLFESVRLEQNREGKEKQDEERGILPEQDVTETPQEETVPEGKEEEPLKEEVKDSFSVDAPFYAEKKLENVAEVFEKCENCPYQKKRMERQEETDAFEKMLAEYPKLPMYGVTELFQCVRIHPRDIGKLDMRNWKLGVNSFLTHGFYTYQYLLLGKMRFDDGKEHPIIGVPGVFSNREKYLANMFGFEQFIPIRKTGLKTGEFGYWIVELYCG